MQSPPPEANQHALDRPWRLWASTLVGTFTLVSLLLGIVILPSVEDGGNDPFGSICRALGIPGYRLGPSAARTARPAAAGTEMIWSAASRHLVVEGNAERGATLLADVCAACHGDAGIAVDPNFPNLAHQAPEAVFKQLRDYAALRRSGGQADIMAPIAAALDHSQMADVAAYIGTLHAVDRVAADTAVPPAIEQLARHGDPRRGLPACAACHNADGSGPEETPVLLGQSVPYLESQLNNFADGLRGNDVYGRMRSIAARLTARERHHLAVYYGGKPAPHVTSR